MPGTGLPRQLTKWVRVRPSAAARRFILRDERLSLPPTALASVSAASLALLTISAYSA